MIARSWAHTSWWLSLILFIWTSIQSLPLLSLQDALTLFLYIFGVACKDTSSVSKQERQSAEGVFRSESAMFPLEKPESEDVLCLVLFELPATTLSSGSARALMKLEERLEDSCLCHPEPVLVSGIRSGMWSSPHVDLWVLFLWWPPKEPHFCWEGLARDSKNECPMEGVPSKGRSGRRGMVGGWFSGEWVGLLESPGAVSSSQSVTSAVAGVVSLCHSAATSASPIWWRGHQ